MNKLLITRFIDTDNIAIKVNGSLITLPMPIRRPGVVKVLEKDVHHIEHLIIEKVSDDEYIIKYER